MSFEENVSSFYMALAEEKLEDMCQSLSNMRLVVKNALSQHLSQTDDEIKQEGAVHQEMLFDCERKAAMMSDKAISQLKVACTQGDDIDHILTSFYLCCELDVASRGAPILTVCLTRIFTNQARCILERVVSLKATTPVNEHGYIDRNFYIEALNEVMTGTTNLMNTIADDCASTKDQTIVKQIIGPIHEVCTQVTLEIVQFFAMDARMQAWERRAIDQARRAIDQARRDVRDSDTPIESDESLQMVDLFLDELSFILRIMTSYGVFLKSIHEEIDTRESKFQIKLQELNGVYLLLERFYIFQSVHKATEIAEVQELEQNVFVSSIVEDVSFVLNKAFFRASQCMTYHTALSITIALVDALESMYLPSILELPKRPFDIPIESLLSKDQVTVTSSGQGKSKNSKNNPNGDTGISTGSGSGGGSGSSESSTFSGPSFSDMLLQAVDDDLTRSVQDEAKLIMAINSSYMSMEFLQNFATKIETLSACYFPKENPILESLPKSLHESIEAYKSIVENEIEEILNHPGGINERMYQKIMETFSTLNYQLDTKQYDLYETIEGGSIFQKLIQEEIVQDKVLKRYEKTLCVFPFEKLILKWIHHLIEWIEEAIKTQQYNELGALQLEKEISFLLVKLIDFVVTSPRKPHNNKQHSNNIQETLQLEPSTSSTINTSGLIRTEFTRLFQMVLILNLADPIHVIEYESIKKELNLAEIEQLLRLRCDFKDDIVTKAMQQLWINVADATSTATAINTSISTANATNATSTSRVEK